MPDLSGLYVITDQTLMAETGFIDAAEQALSGGARVMQYRDKSGDTRKRQRQAQELKRLCDRYDAVLIINDDIQLARQVDAHGVHIGADDTPLQSARRELGEQRIIGVSCYNRFDLAEQAVRNGGDYVAFGSFFTSPTKPEAVPAELELLTRARRQLQVPVCAIGGITHDNASSLIDHGADMIAVISAIFGDHDIRHACERFVRLFNTSTV